MSDKLALAKGAEMRPEMRPEVPSDKPAIDALMHACFGKGRHLRSVRHLRLCAPYQDLCFVLTWNGKLVGSIRYWPILVQGRTQLLLGPLAVDPDYKGQGFGKSLVAHSLESAHQHDFDFILISGEPDYYPRFGFESASSAQFIWPGFLEPERLQIKWLKPQSSRNMTSSSQAILPILAETV